MRKRLIAALYTVLALSANPAFAQAEELAALRQGSLEKLMFSDPVDVPEVALTTREGAPAQLSDYRGKVVVVNFWATWCAPCRAEMPSLSALETALGGADFAVVPVATGRNEAAGIDRFLTEAGVSNLPVLLDPQMDLAHQMGVMALPVTVILNREGQEIGRLIGDADWASDSAQAILRALIAQ